MRHKHPTKPRWKQFNFLCINFSSICVGHRAMFVGANATVVPIGGAGEYSKHLPLWGGGEYLLWWWQRWKLSRYARSNRSMFPLFIQSFKIELNEITAAHSSARSTWCPWRWRRFIIRHINRGNRVPALTELDGWTTFCRWCEIECAQMMTWVEIVRHNVLAF